MVKQRDVEDLCGLPEHTGHPNVSGAGFGISRRVVVRDDEGGGIRQDRAFEDLARMSEARGRSSESHQMATDGVILAVEIDRVESLLSGVLIERRPEVTERTKSHC